MFDWKDGLLIAVSQNCNDADASALAWKNRATQLERDLLVTKSELARAIAVSDSNFDTCDAILAEIAEKDKNPMMPRRLSNPDNEALRKEFRTQARRMSENKLRLSMGLRPKPINEIT